VTRREPAWALLCALAAGPAFGAPANPREAVVTIGLFLPVAGPEAAAGEAARRGAAIAAGRANREGGVAGRPVRLAGARSDGPWDSAARELVRLIYEEGAVAVVGALDGRTGHLAEQVITRARGRAIFVTPWASETTLTRVRIPWFFSLVPDDRLQARRLAEEIFSARSAGRVAVWVDETFDGRSAAAAFEELAPRGSVVRFDAADPRAFETLAERMLTGEIDALLLFASPRNAAAVVLRLPRGGTRAPLFGPLSLAVPAFLAAVGGAAEGLWIVAPDALGSKTGAEFRRAFRRAHGTDPGPLAMYAHDAVLALVAALRESAAGPRRPLEEALAAVRTAGASGPIRFDGRRSRSVAPGLMVVRAPGIVPSAPPGQAAGR
jgi:branched-chain amino acid transport system substrate-binding protein